MLSLKVIFCIIFLNDFHYAIFQCNNTQMKSKWTVVASLIMSQNELKKM